jgi:hypothetical protein
MTNINTWVLSLEFRHLKQINISNFIILKLKTTEKMATAYIKDTGNKKNSKAGTEKGCGH